MPITLVRRTILFLLFATLLASAWPVSAATTQRQRIEPVQAIEWPFPEILNRFWNFLRGGEGKDGCHIDPHGRCTTAQSPETQRKDGCHIDPDGRCLP